MDHQRRRDLARSQQHPSRVLTARYVRIRYRQGMAMWDDLKVVLFRLREESLNPLASYPDPRVDRDRVPPFGIDLAAWATDVAADLNGRFGADVELVVGGLQYPSRALSRPLLAPPVVPDLGPAEMSLVLVGPLSVRSGHTETHGIRLHNPTAQEVGIVTNRQVTASVVDPDTNRQIGGFPGPQRLPRHVFHVAPGGTERIPLIVGTASFVPDLGYAVPPGEWALRITLNLDDGRAFRTPSLPFTITE